MVLKDAVGDPQQAAAEHARDYGADVGHVYEFALKGYAARIPAQRLAALRGDPRVLFVSEDREVATTDTHAGELPYGVDRLDGELSSKAGSNNSAPAIAVIDTGSGPHSELNLAGGKNCNTGMSYNDGNGHGTHVAGTNRGVRDLAGLTMLLVPDAPPGPQGSAVDGRCPAAVRPRVQEADQVPSQAADLRRQRRWNGGQAPSTSEGDIRMVRRPRAGVTSGAVYYL